MVVFLFFRKKMTFCVSLKHFSKLNPIMMKVYQAAGAGAGGGMHDMGGMGGSPPPAGAGPTVEEVD